MCGGLEYFSKPGDTFLSGFQVVLSCYSPSCFVWVFDSFQYTIFFNEYGYPLNTLPLLWYSSMTLCKPITTNFANSHEHYGSGLFCIIQGKARWDMTRQGMVLHQRDRTKKVSSEFENFCISTLFMLNLFQEYIHTFVFSTISHHWECTGTYILPHIKWEGIYLA